MFLNWLHRKLRQSPASRCQRRPAVGGKFARPCLEPLEDRTLLSTYLVTNTNDSGDGSLRQAILNVNNGSGGDTIAFDIGGGGVQTIRPTSALPTLTQSVTLDGTTQPGYAGTPLIELAGNLAGGGVNGLTIVANNSVVRGLAIDLFSNYGNLGGGIAMVLQGDGNRIEGCYLGTDPTGTQPFVGNTVGGLSIMGSDNVIGGTTLGAGNLISSNGLNGVVIAGNNNVVQGNTIGADITGTQALGNQSVGIDITTGDGNLIGGTDPGAGNLISGNKVAGVKIDASNNNVVQGNLIGTDITGTQALGNGGSGDNRY